MILKVDIHDLKKKNHCKNFGPTLKTILWPDPENSKKLRGRYIYSSPLLQPIKKTLVNLHTPLPCQKVCMINPR